MLQTLDLKINRHLDEIEEVVGQLEAFASAGTRITTGLPL